VYEYEQQESNLVKKKQKFWFYLYLQHIIDFFKRKIRKLIALVSVLNKTEKYQVI